MRNAHEQPRLMPGRILIAGTGFIVISGMWLILAYFRNEGGENLIALLNLALALLHIAIGVAIFYRLRPAWYGGLVLAVVAAAASYPNAYPFPIGPELAMALILYLTRQDFRGIPADESAH
ncbi:MAG TPA: hypothetical protein VFI42_11285 [Thermomicrobiaceae bacterium]|nr:hypothetical protein [Thermomicrobiaceae bacterium]